MKKHVGLLGILNITPDSFSNDGIYNSTTAATHWAQELFTVGADLIDVGAEATNPWAGPITPTTEWQRLKPVLAELLPAYPDKISVDTHHPETVAHIVAAFGTHVIVNDVTGMNDPAMRDIVAKHNLRCIVSHFPARFGTDITAAHASADMNQASQVLDELIVRRDQLLDLGLDSSKIILDPGIGFGKTAKLNEELLQFASLVRSTGLPNEVLIGYSRKRFLGEKRFEIQPNLDAAKIAVTAGADYLRVHDVAAHKKLLDSLAHL